MSGVGVRVLPVRLSGAVMALSAPLSLPAIPTMGAILVTVVPLGTNVAGALLAASALLRFVCGMVLCQFGCEREGRETGRERPAPSTAFGPGWAAGVREAGPARRGLRHAYARR